MQGRRLLSPAWLVDLRIRTKIAIVGGCALLTALIVAFTGIYEIQRLHDDIARLSDRNVAGLNEINAVQLALADVILNGIQARTADPSSRRELQIREDAAIVDVEKAFATYLGTPAVDSEWQALIDNFDVFWADFHRLCLVLRNAPEGSTDYSDAARGYPSALYRVKEAVGDLATYERDAAETMRARGAVTYHAAIRTIVVAFLIGVLLATLLIRSVARAIVRPLTDVQQVLGAVAAGDLTRRAKVRGRDEVGLMATWVNQASDGIRSILQELEAAHEKLRHQATHDSLTGLPNRRHFEERIREALDNEERISLVLVDLDDFKEVNDSLGHLVGDQLLIGVGRRLSSLISPSDLIARLGGDEFALLVDVARDGEALGILDRLADACQLPIHVDEHSLQMRCSAGQADSWPGADMNELFRRADVALYAAKGRGKSCGARYESNLEQVASQLEPTP